MSRLLPPLEDWVARALEVRTEERMAFLEAECRDEALRLQVIRFLESEAKAERFFEDAKPGRLLVDASASAFIGRRAGAYRIVDEIGRGGMGSVYRAERDDGQFTRQVAVKVISVLAAGSDGWRRFEIERKVLAGLKHPNIAQLLDAGATDDGTPYLVMELVDGLPVHRYCEQRALSIRARIKLFRQVCDAVHFAHQNLVIHRDLKPANILVTADGTPKLLDFGISKVLEEDPTLVEATRPENRLMSVPYASPEQIRGEAITTASDVYSLGLVLFELLTGKPAFARGSASMPEFLRAICEDTPSAPNLPRDLESIVLKAVAKVPAERYGSARELAADLDNYLAGMPVLAVRPTNLYRLGKWVRRHRAPVAVGVAVAAALVAAGVAIVWQMRVAQRERAIAEGRFNDVRKLANSILFEFHDGVSTLAGATEVRRLMVARSAEYLDSLAKDARGDVALQLELASAYVRLGDVQGNANFANLGDRSGALSSYGKARVILQTLLDAEPAHRLGLLKLGSLLQSTSYLLRQDGQIDASIGMARRSLAHWEEMARTSPTDEEVLRGLGAAYFGLAGVTKLTWEERIGYWNQSQEVYDKQLEARPSDPDRMRNVALVHKYLSSMYGVGHPSHRDDNQYLKHARIAAELDERRVKARPQDAASRLDLAFSLSMVATAWRHNDDLRQAVTYAARSAQIRRDLWEADSKDHRARDRLAFALALLGDYRREQGDIKGALASLREAVDHAEALTRDTDFYGAWQTLVLARLALGRLAGDGSNDRCAQYRQAYEAFRHVPEAQRGEVSNLASDAEAGLSACGARGDAARNGARQGAR